MRHSLYNKGNRDDNEPEILEILNRYGIPYRQGRPGDGYDLLILAPGGAQLWEIKNPEQSPSKRKLTDSEQVVLEWCTMCKIPYHIVETVEDAVRLCMLSKSEKM